MNFSRILDHPSVLRSVKYLFALVGLIAILQSCKTDHAREQAVNDILHTLTAKDTTYEHIKAHIEHLYGDSVIVLNDAAMTRLGKTDSMAYINFAKIYQEYTSIKKDLEELWLQQYIIPLEKFAEAIAAQEMFHMSKKGKSLPNAEAEMASDFVSLEKAGPFYLYFILKDVFRYYHAAAEVIQHPEKEITLEELVWAISEGYALQTMTYITTLVSTSIPEEEIIEAGSSEEAFKQFMKKYPDLLERLSK